MGDPADTGRTLIDYMCERIGIPQRLFLAQQGRKSAEGRTWTRETRKLVTRYHEAIARQRQRSFLGRIWPVPS